MFLSLWRAHWTSFNDVGACRWNDMQLSSTSQRFNKFSLDSRLLVWDVPDGKREKEMLPVWTRSIQDPITIGIHTRHLKPWPVLHTRRHSAHLETHKQGTFTNTHTRTHSSVSAWNDIPQSPGRLHGSVAMTTGYSCQIWSDIKIQWEKEGEQHRRRAEGWKMKGGNKNK